MAFQRRHMTSNDSILIFLKRPHKELQFEYHIEYVMKLLIFDPSDPTQILVKWPKKAKNDQNLTFFLLFFTEALLKSHFTTPFEILSKSAKFRISTKNQEFERIAPHLTFFVKIILNWLNFPKKIKKNVPKRAGPSNGRLKQKMAKNEPKMALKWRHMTSNDSVLIFLERPHQELQFEYHIGYVIRLLKFDPSDSH